MSSTSFIDNAQVMSKGQVTIPKDVRDVLGVGNGGRVSFIVEGENVRIVNSAAYAMQEFQKAMAGMAEESGLTSEDKINAYIKQIRNDGVSNVASERVNL